MRLQMRAWRRLMQVRFQLMGALDRELQASHGLSMADYEVLITLSEAGEMGMRMTDLAERLLLSPSEWEKEHVDGLADLPASVLAATRDNVEEAVGEWHDLAGSSRDNVVILYAAGHGIQMSKDDGGIVLLQCVSGSDDRQRDGMVFPARDEQEWSALGRDPDIGEVAWFTSAE